MRCIVLFFCVIFFIVACTESTPSSNIVNEAISSSYLDNQNQTEESSSTYIGGDTSSSYSSSTIDSVTNKTITFTSVTYNAYINVPLPLNFNATCFRDNYPSIKKACTSNDSKCIEYQYKKIISKGGSPTLSCDPHPIERIVGDNGAVSIIHPKHSQQEVPYHPLLLEWEPIENARYDIFIDTTTVLATVLSREEIMSNYTVTDLKPATTYYWRVDAILDTTLMRGDVQVFTTESFVDLPPRIRVYGDSLYEKRDGRVEIVISDPEGETLFIDIDSPIPLNTQKIDSGFAILLPKEEVTFDGLHTIKIHVYDTTGTPHTVEDSVELCVDLPTHVLAMDTIIAYQGDDITVMSSYIYSNDKSIVQDSFDIQKKIYLYSAAPYGDFYFQFSQPTEFMGDAKQKDPDTDEQIKIGTLITTDTITPGIYTIPYEIVDRTCNSAKTDFWGTSRSFELTLIVKDPKSISHCTTLECDLSIIHHVKSYMPGHITDYTITDGRITDIQLSYQYNQIFIREFFALTALKNIPPLRESKFNLKDLILFKHFPQLETLSLESSYIPKDLEYIPSLKKLYLSGQELITTDFEEEIDFSVFPNLESLSLAYYEYTYIPESIRSLSPHLKVLRLPGISIDDEILQSISHLTELESLFVTHVHSSNGPHSIDTFKHLKALEIGSLTPLVSEKTTEPYPALTKLTIHTLNQNPIPEEIFSFSNLTYLKLDSGYQETIPDEILNINKLERLYLKNTGIKNAAILNAFPNLKILDLSGNALDSVPDSFGDLPSLEHLWLAFMPNLHLNDTLLTLPNLIDLSIVGSGYCRKGWRNLTNGSQTLEYEAWRYIISSQLGQCQ